MPYQINLNNNLVSIVMTTHNCEKFIKYTINSIINQSFQNWELIIVDDASTDKTIEQLNMLLHKKVKQQFWILQNKTNKNLSYSRNRGIKKAQGRFLAFIDHDDIWSRNKLEEQVFFHQEKNCFLSHSFYRHFNKNFELGHLIKSKDYLQYKDLLKVNTIAFSSVMIDRVFEKNFLFIS